MKFSKKWAFGCVGAGFLLGLWWMSSVGSRKPSQDQEEYPPLEKSQEMFHHIKAPVQYHLVPRIWNRPPLGVRH